MAVQLDPPGQLQDFLGILTRRKWQVILPAIFFLSLGVAAAVIIPKKYLVETQVELRPFAAAGGEADYTAKERTEGVAENAPQQIKSMRRITEVIESLKWADYLTLNRKDQVEYRTRVRDNIKIIVPKKGKDVGSSFVTIEYRDVSRDRAQEFLKALRQAWIEQVVERDRTRIDVEYSNLLSRKSELEKEWYSESRLLAELRNDNSISPTQPTPGKNQQRFEDPTISRFDRNTTRLGEVELELKVQAALLKARQEQLAETEPETPVSEVIGGISYEQEIADLLRSRADLEDQLSGIKPAHSRYRIVQSKLLELDKSIKTLESQQSEGKTNVEFAPNKVYLALSREIAQLEGEVVALETERETLRELLAQDREDLVRLAEAYREDSERSSRIEILTTTLAELELRLQNKKQQREVVNGPAGNPFQILQDVEPPADPSEPDPVLILVFSLVLGIGVGLGSALVSEFSRSCFRNPADLSRVMVIPTLGVISPIVTLSQRRRRLLRRTIVAISSLALTGSVLFLTWAWAYEPDLLGSAVMDSIENFRSLFL